MVTLRRRSDGLSWLQVVADRGADASAEHRRAALLRPQRGTRLPHTHTNTGMCLTGEAITGASTVNLSVFFLHFFDRYQRGFKHVGNLGRVTPQINTQEA